jgi:hypothetical protein
MRIETECAILKNVRRGPLLQSSFVGLETVRNPDGFGFEDVLGQPGMALQAPGDFHTLAERSGFMQRFNYNI